MVQNRNYNSGTTTYSDAFICVYMGIHTHMEHACILYYVKEQEQRAWDAAAVSILSVSLGCFLPGLPAQQGRKLSHIKSCAAGRNIARSDLAPMKSSRPAKAVSVGSHFVCMITVLLVLYSEKLYVYPQNANIESHWSSTTKIDLGGSF
ncbi:uncharacterized protein LOC116246810 [Nymphaea colorata]|uniref:uncharacterized protein LOC116246810 n=1 Tax=Nymphaea colorata TaxID=210225 RepID=UPI00129E3DBD|nr:uncharacterized protein LOC116246810 [Nymphaea colorata]